jgi:hypothetical protein
VTSGIRPKLETYFNYDPHTVSGAWDIVLTVILAVFVLLLLLRLLSPVTPNPLTNDDELELLLAAPADRAEV